MRNFCMRMRIETVQLPKSINIHHTGVPLNPTIWPMFRVFPLLSCWKIDLFDKLYTILKILKFLVNFWAVWTHFGWTFLHTVVIYALLNLQIMQNSSFFLLKLLNQSFFLLYAGHQVDTLVDFFSDLSLQNAVNIHVLYCLVPDFVGNLLYLQS
jgi:hypothetical protein